MAAIEARERERTGIGSLKVKYNNVFGYYIEVTRAQLAHADIPAEYVRKQTVANAERFVTPELAEYEAKILSADERRVAIETEIFERLRAEVAGRVAVACWRWRRASPPPTRWRRWPRSRTAAATAGPSSTIRASSTSPTAATRSSSAWPPRAASCPTTSASTPTASRS